MNYLKRQAVAISLVVVLASATFAGETNTPPCAIPGETIPGETNTPPCATQFVDDSSGEATALVSEVEIFILEATTYGMASLLIVF